MKTLKICVAFLALTLCAGFMSCSDDDEGTNESILGAWQSALHSYRIWVFEKNGHVYSEDEAGTYRVRGDKLHITWTDEYGDYDEDFLIMELTSSRLTLDELDDETGEPLNDPESFKKISVDEND